MDPVWRRWWAVLLAVYAVWVAAPLVWVAVGSGRTDEALVRDPLGVPESWEVVRGNYERAWAEGGLGGAFANSVWVTVLSVLGVVLPAAMAAYALARWRHPLRRVVLGVLVAGLVVPAQLSAVPLFFELRALGLLGTRAGLVLVYIAHGLPFAILVLVAFFRAVPASLHEAAVIDGAGEWTAFRRVHLPLVAPGLATVAIFQGLAAWKEYFLAFLLLGGEGAAEVRTLPLGLGSLSLAATYRADRGLLFAGIVLVVVPLLVAYLFLQRRIVAGLAAGGVKG